MGYEGLTQMIREGLKAWAILIAAALAWLFGGDWRAVLHAGHDWIWPQPEAERVDEDTARVEAETDRLLRTLDRDMEPEPHVSLARRFLNGDMTADITAMGAAMAGRVVSIKAQNLPFQRWSDRRLSEIIRGQDVDIFDYVAPRQRALEDQWAMEPSGYAH